MESELRDDSDKYVQPQQPLSDAAADDGGASLNLQNHATHSYLKRGSGGGGRVPMHLHRFGHRGDGSGKTGTNAAASTGQAKGCRSRDPSCGCRKCSLISLGEVEPREVHTMIRFIKQTKV